MIKPIKIKPLLFGMMVLIACMICMHPSHSPASGEQDFSGHWVGETVADKVYVDLTSKSIEARPVYEFHYGSPHNCYVTASEGSMDDGKLKLRILKTNGGTKCDHLWNGFLLLSITPEKTMNVEVRGKNDDIIDRAILKQENK